MPRKNDFIKRFEQHYHYSQKALRWAQESIDLEIAGKGKSAARAQEYAKEWLAKAMALEPTGLRFTPASRRARSRF
jgi:hypothetical protein